MALVYHLDASNPASWANAGTNPEPWTDISGTLVPPGGTPATTWPIQVSNLPTLITDGAVKGLRMISQSGGTYPNGSAILQRGAVYVGSGNPSGSTQLGNLWWGGSYSVQMWIKFNQAPIGGSSNATDRLPTIIWSSVVSGNGPVIIFGANLADTLRPRANDARIGVQWGAADVTPTYVATGEWAPDVDTWYMATIVCNRSSSTTGTLSLFINDTQSGTSVSYTSTTSPMFEWMGSGGSFTGGMALNSSYTTAATPGDSYFGGDITFSTFKIFNTALSSAEITAAFSSESLAFGYAPGVLQNPQVMLRWSDDGGHTWSNEHWASMGALGAYGTRVIWRRLGMTEKLRDRVYEVSGTDPVKVSIVGAELSISPTNG